MGDARGICTNKPAPNTLVRVANAITTAGQEAIVSGVLGAAVGGTAGFGVGGPQGAVAGGSVMGSGMALMGTYRGLVDGFNVGVPGATFSSIVENGIKGHKNNPPACPLMKPSM